MKKIMLLPLIVLALGIVAVGVLLYRKPELRTNIINTMNIVNWKLNRSVPEMIFVDALPRESGFRSLSDDVIFALAMKPKEFAPLSLRLSDTFFQLLETAQLTDELRELKTAYEKKKDLLVKLLVEAKEVLVAANSKTVTINDIVFPHFEIVANFENNDAANGLKDLLRTLIVEKRKLSSSADAQGKASKKAAKEKPAKNQEAKRGKPIPYQLEAAGENEFVIVHRLAHKDEKSPLTHIQIQGPRITLLVGTTDASEFSSSPQKLVDAPRYRETVARLSDRQAGLFTYIDWAKLTPFLLNAVSQKLSSDDIQQKSLHAVEAFDAYRAIAMTANWDRVLRVNACTSVDSNKAVGKVVLESSQHGHPSVPLKESIFLRTVDALTYFSFACSTDFLRQAIAASNVVAKKDGATADPLHDMKTRVLRFLENTKIDRLNLVVARGAAMIPDVSVVLEGKQVGKSSFAETFRSAVAELMHKDSGNFVLTKRANGEPIVTYPIMGGMEMYAGSVSKRIFIITTNRQNFEQYADRLLAATFYFTDEYLKELSPAIDAAVYLSARNVIKQVKPLLATYDPEKAPMLNQLADFFSNNFLVVSNDSFVKPETVCRHGQMGIINPDL